MRKSRNLMLASLAAGLLFWSLPTTADPLPGGDLLAGGDVRTRQSGIKVGSPRVNQDPAPGRDKVAPTAPPTAPPTTPPPSNTTAEPPTVGMVPIPLPTGGFARAEEASALVDKLAGQGLGTRFVGVGKVAGEMVEIQATNKSDRPLRFYIVPGMVLEAPAGSNVQPLVLEDELPITLAPGEQFSKRLNAYCLDYRVDPPEKGQLVDYKFANPLSPTWTEPVKVLISGLKLESGAQFNPILRPLQHRRVVIQRAIWEVLGQRQDAPALKQAVQDSSGNRITKRTEGKIVDAIRKDMDRVIAESKR